MRNVPPCDGTPPVSPLTGLPARLSRACRDSGFWLLVEEEDGLSYVVPSGLSPGTGDEARQLLLFARYCASRGRLALFVRPGDDDAYRKQRPDLHLPKKVEAWTVPG